VSNKTNGRAILKQSERLGRGISVEWSDFDPDRGLTPKDAQLARRAAICDAHDNKQDVIVQIRVI
jgi:hypothetical protein